MFKKLLNLASNIIKPGQTSENNYATTKATAKDGNPPTPSFSLEHSIQPEQEPSPILASGSANLPLEESAGEKTPIELDLPEQRSDLNTKKDQSLDLTTLYRSMTLSQSMLYIAESLAVFNPKTYIQTTENWLHDSDFQTLGAIAITAKRQGDYAKAIAIFDDLAQGCPYYYQIHHSSMKILGASGDLEAAFRALQLWCVATIPEKTFRFNFSKSQRAEISDSRNVAQLPYLAGWAIAESKSMYHLGSLHMILSGELATDAADAYTRSLQGKKQQALHNPKHAIQRGKDIAQDLPWDSLISVMHTEMWQQLLAQSWQQAQTVEQRHNAA